MTQTELASLSGVSQAHISRLELGRRVRPSHDVVIRLAKALGTKPDKLAPPARPQTV